MYDYLVNHALQNVWCNPEQDGQHIIKPHRISPVVGVMNSFKLMLRYVSTPTKSDTYHIFQIGQLHPRYINLFQTVPDWSLEKWVKFSDCCTSQKLIVDIYTDRGINIPRCEVYYLFTRDRDLIIAVKENSKIPIDYRADDLYLRVYSNAYFNSIRGNVNEEGVSVQGGKLTSVEDILTWQNLQLSYASKSGLCYAYVNGYVVSDLSPLTATVGDTVELVYDSSIIRSVTLNVSDLGVFNSELDNLRKYLLHYANSGDTSILYMDDVDFYVIQENAGSKYRGLYFHKNQASNVRMVTHRDYSIAVQVFKHIATALVTDVSDESLDYRSLKIVFHIRKSGYDRNLIYDNNRIFEMYKLSDSNVLRAMSGVDAQIPYWVASTLEKCAYTQIMRSEAIDVTRALVQEGYGYNSISKILGDTPSKTALYSSRQRAIVPYGLQDNCTAYEYDKDGYLLEVHKHTGGSDYNATNANTALVELISGLGSAMPNVTFGEDNLNLPTYDNYRVYMCHKTNSGLDNIWKDITGTNQYSVMNNTLVWNNLDFNQFLMVRTDGSFLSYDFNVTPTKGVLKLELVEYEDRGNGKILYPLPVPMGELSLFLNGKSLIEGLDYVVDFPMVYIRNKKYLTSDPDNTPQWIHVRFTGFCQSDLSREDDRDYGFIQHGVLSNNNRFDIRDDKVLRITVDGAVHHRDDVVFSELHSGISVVNAENGLPYQIDDIVVPLKNLTDENTYSLRAKSKVIDAAVSAYMTEKLPQPDRSAPSSITKRYDLYSPFVSSVMWGLINEEIDPAILKTALTDVKILELCKPYEGWLKYDPTQAASAVDYNHVLIHPHNRYTVIEIDLFKYRFLKRVVSLYCNGLVELSPFLTLKSL
jgi:hypothetical protein